MRAPAPRRPTRTSRLAPLPVDISATSVGAAAPFTARRTAVPSSAPAPLSGPQARSTRAVVSIRSSFARARLPPFSRRPSPQRERRLASGRDSGVEEPGPQDGEAPQTVVRASDGFGRRGAFLGSGGARPPAADSALATRFCVCGPPHRARRPLWPRQDGSRWQRSPIRAAKRARSEPTRSAPPHALSFLPLGGEQARVATRRGLEPHRHPPAEGCGELDSRLTSRVRALRSPYRFDGCKRRSSQSIEDRRDADPWQSGERGGEGGYWRSGRHVAPSPAYSSPPGKGGLGSARGTIGGERGKL